MSADGTVEISLLKTLLDCSQTVVVFLTTIELIGKRKEMVNIEGNFNFEDIEIGDLEVSGVLNLHSGIPFFEGHFPENPVLPAVAIVDASLELLRKKFPEKNINNIQMKRSKFMKMVVPGSQVTLKAVHMGENLWKIVWQEKEVILAQVNLIV